MKRLLQVVTILWVLAPLAVSAAADAPRRVAVVVGANVAAPGRRPLRFAHNDAAETARVLRLAGFAPSDIHVLRDPDPDTLLQSLDHALAELSGQPSLLVFYYSGHADAHALYPNGKELRLNDLRERLDSTKATVRVGIIDACRGGGWTGTKGLSETDLFEVNLPLRLSNEGSVLISSSSGLEDAHESELLRGSFFTHHWNAALRGAGDADEDGTVTLVEAFSYAKSLTIRDTALQTAAPQHPSYQMNLRGKSDLPLVTMTAKASVVAVEQNTGPLQLVHLGSGVVVLEIPRGKRRLRLSVPPGRYVVRRQTGEQVFAREIEVLPGKVTRVDEEKLALVGSAKLAVKGDEPTKRVYLGLGLGGGGISGTDDEAFSQGMSWTIQLGYKLRPQLHLLFNGDYTSFTRYELDPDYSQQQSAITLGVRWAPFEHPPIPGATMLDLTNFHLKAGVGVGHLIRQPFGSFNPLKITQGTWGGAATFGVGWNLIRTESLGFGLEASDSLAIYGDGTRHSFGVNLLFQAALF